MDRSPNVTWQQSRLSRERRWREIGSSGATVWLTGLSGAGKTTIGAMVEERLVESGRPAYLLDGDNLRHGICGDLGFTTTDRQTNIRRVGEVAQMFADAGMVAIVALISPLAGARGEVRERHARAGLPFFEVFVDTPLEVCAARDSKGLYARARAGEVPGFTGVDDPYEPPASPDVHLAGGMPLTAAVDAVLSLLTGQRQGAPR
jgi:bifunctional enzyme CysN/CysC